MDADAERTKERLEEIWVWIEELDKLTDDFMCLFQLYETRLTGSGLSLFHIFNPGYNELVKNINQCIFFKRRFLLEIYMRIMELRNIRSEQNNSVLEEDVDELLCSLFSVREKLGNPTKDRIWISDILEIISKQRVSQSMLASFFQKDLPHSNSPCPDSFYLNSNSSCPVSFYSNSSYSNLN
ncbi:MAG: hypothetical protein Satyrvirus21_4 [Satyrvirus sp.]|uniref:Uncharacterized protein n=1 Tax=Satyrvirus sp. TaxID=2487771 RepID=A0A3G5AEB1_9VIRU|nr:MAG: hypothetical protein Satyrvirus21_4 [Satyrvirus sp.]